MPDWQMRVESFITAQVAARKIPGASVAIAMDGKLIYANGFGLAETGKHTPAKAETPFAIAAVTQSMTATAILQLRDQGLVELDAPVQRYLPWFQLADAKASAAITLRHLLTHTSGIPGNAAGVIWQDWEKLSGNALEAAKAMATVQVKRRPGEAHEHADMGYLLLGLVVEAVTGKPWRTYIQEKLFAPLKLRQSTADQNQAPLNGTAQPHVWRLFSRRPLPARRFGSALAAAGSAAACSAGDLAKFGLLYLGQHPAVLKPPTAAEAHRDGFGWTEGTVSGGRAVWQGGSGEGASASLVLLPERGIVVAVLANINARLDSIAHGIVDLVLGKEPRPGFALDHIRARMGLLPILLDALAGVLVLWAALFSAMGRPSVAPAVTGVVALAAGLLLLTRRPFATDLPVRKVGKYFPEMMHGITSLMLAGVMALAFAALTLSR